MPKRLLLTALFPALLAAGDILDRVAVTVDRQMIAVSDVRNDIRMTALLNREPLSFSAANMRAAAERLIDQALLRQEMELTNFPIPEDAEAAKALEQAKAPLFASDAEYRQALDKYGVTERMLRNYFRWQLRVLRYIEFRFAPGVLVPQAELERYYREVYLPDWRKRNAGRPPSLEEVRPQVERLFSARRANEALEDWLRAARNRSEIRYRKGAFP